MIEFVVKDQMMYQPNEFLGRAEIPMTRLAIAGNNREEIIALFRDGFPAGNIIIRAEYVPQAVVSG